MAAADDLYTDKAETMESGRSVYVVFVFQVLQFPVHVPDFCAINCPTIECGT